MHLAIDIIIGIILNGKGMRIGSIIQDIDIVTGMLREDIKI